jgi:hypothetical protein
MITIMTSITITLREALEIYLEVKATMMGGMLTKSNRCRKEGIRLAATLTLKVAVELKEIIRLQIKVNAKTMALSKENVEIQMIVQVQALILTSKATRF